MTISNYFSNVRLICLSTRLRLLFVLFACISITSCQNENNTIGNIIRIRIAAEPDGLNPMLTTSGYSRQIMNNMFPSLLRFDPHTLELTPYLVKSLPTINRLPNEEIAYTYEIHEKAVWDNGQPVLASDLIFSLKVIFNPKIRTVYRPFFQAFLKDAIIDEKNPKRFTIYADKPYILIEQAIAAIYLFPSYIFDPDNLLRDVSLADLIDPDKANQLAESEPKLTQFSEAFTSVLHTRKPAGVVSCGPYKLKEWKSNQRIILEKKENWWGDGLLDAFPILTAKPQKLIYIPLPEITTAISELRNGNLDIVSPIPPMQFVDLRNSQWAEEKLNLFTPLSLRTGSISINCADPKLSDRKVRRALAHLANVDRMIEQLFFNFGERIVGPIHPSKPYYHKDLELIPFSIEEAKRLLAEAGWSDTNGNGIIDKEIDGVLEELELLLITPTQELTRRLAVIYKDNAKKAGIEVKIASKEFSTLIRDIESGNFDIYFLGSGNQLGPYDPYQDWHTKSIPPARKGTNRTRFGNAKTDALIEEIRRTMDEEKRNELYKKFQEILYEDQPRIFLWAVKDRIAISKRIKGVTTRPEIPGYVETFMWAEE